MKTILFPTDFSSPALDALKYTVELCDKISASKLIIYHSFEISHPEMIMLTDILIPLPVQINELKTEANQNLRSLDSTLLPLVNKGITIEFITDERPLVRALKEILEAAKVDLIALGLSGVGNNGKNIVGKNTSRIMNECDISTLIIPKNAAYKNIGKSMLACELKSIAERLPVSQLKGLLHLFQSKLFIVNVDHNESTNPSDLMEEETTLHQLLDDVNPEYHYIDHKNKSDALLEFAKSQKADLMIAVYRKRGLLEQFFHNSITKKLAINTSIPLLILHKKN